MPVNARFRLFCDYINNWNRLRQIPEESESELQSRYVPYLESLGIHTDWVDVFAPDDLSQIAGFLVIGATPNCHPDADYYIEEAYISPEYRRSGLMKRCVTEYIREHYGRYCLFIINNNELAKRFWEDVMKSLSYVPIHLVDVGAGDQYCTQYGFAPIREEEISWT